MKALITGGAGFIGSHVADSLLDRGWQVVILDDLSTGRMDNLSRALAGPYGSEVAMVQGSITDAPLVDRLAEGADVIIHLAAATGFLTMQNRTLDSLHVNVRGTEAVLDAARRTGARVLVASTSDIYGKNTTIGLREDADRIIGSPLKSRWSCAESEALREVVTHRYAAHLGVPAVIVRLFHTAGPRQTGRYGRVIPRFVEQALAGEPLTVYGTGGQTRCFAHVFDVVPALLKLLDKPAAYGSVFNIGSPEQISINDLAERVLEHTGSSSNIAHIDYESAYGPGYEDPQRRVPDCSRLFRLIGYRPAYDLDDIIDHIVADQSSTAAAPLSLAAD